MNKFDKIMNKLREKLAKIDKKYKISTNKEAKRAVLRLHRLIDPDYDREDY
jgi:hypothetical protein